MKRLLGILCFIGILVSCACMAVFFAVQRPQNRVEAFSYHSTDTYFEGRFNYFKKFDESSGIFILKERDVQWSLDDVYYGDINITKDSNMSEYTKFEYEVLREIDGVWRKSDASDWFELIIGWNRTSVEYRLPKLLPAGKYGVRVTAYEDSEWGDSNIAYEFDVDGNYRAVTSVYVIMYSEDLSYIYCAERDGVSVYDVRTRGLGRDVQVSVFVNPGAVTHEGLIAASVGNLTLDAAISLNNMSVVMEDASGVELSKEVIPFSVSGGGILIELPNTLAAGKYVLKVYHDSNGEIFGSYVIDNAGGGAVGTSTREAGIVLIVFGVIIGIGCGGLFAWPRVQNAVNEIKFRNAENKRLAGAIFGGDVDASKEKSDSSSGKRRNKVIGTGEKRKIEDITKSAMMELRMKRNSGATMQEEEVDAPSEAKLKANSFIQKMYENRLKREMAREAGLSMDEFKEIEAQHKKVQAAKGHSLSSFRKAVEDKTGVITKEQEDVEGLEDVQSVKSYIREDEQPEVEILDSVKSNEPVEEKSDGEEEVVEEKKGNESILQRLKKFTEDE